MLSDLSKPLLVTLLAPLAAGPAPTDESLLARMTVRSIALADGGGVWLAGTVPGETELRLQPGVFDTDFGIARTDSEGNPDPSFGEGGVVRVDFGGDATGAVPSANEDALALAPVGDGVVAVGRAGGYARLQLAAARVDGSGVRVSSFGSGGRFVDEGKRRSFASAVRVAPDGSLLVAGVYASGGIEGDDVLVARFDPDGALDAGYGGGTGGLGAVLERNGGDDLADAEVVGGALWVLAGASFRVGRVTAAGELDPAFGEGGWFELEDDCHGWALEPTPGGGALVAGTVKPSGSRRPIFRFVELRPNGTLDPAFGVVDWDPDTGGNEPPAQAGATRGLVVDEAGGFLVYAPLLQGIAKTAYLFRFDPAGAPASSWGAGGRVGVEAGFLDPFEAMSGTHSPHHMVRDGARVLVADTLYRNDEVGNSHAFVWVEAFEL